MEYTPDEETLTIGSANYYAESDSPPEFEVPLRALKGLLLSEVPVGVRVVPCNPVIGGTELFRIEYCGGFSREADGRCLAHCEVAFICEHDEAPSAARADHLRQQAESAAAALRAGDLSPLIHSIETFHDDEIAIVYVTVVIPDQTFSDAIIYIGALCERIAANSDVQTLFLCHASEDKAFVDKLDERLRQDAQFAWYDKREIFVGDSIVAEINRGLAQAKYVIAVLSPHSVGKSWATRELSSSMARQYANDNIRVLPVLLANCTVPPLLADIRYADFRNSFESGYSDLLSAIRRVRRTA